MEKLDFVNRLLLYVIEGNEWLVFSRNLKLLVFLVLEVLVL